MNCLNFIEFIKRTLRALNCTNIDYVIVGGILVSIYGEPRATKDVDVILRISPNDKQSIQRLLECFKKVDFEIPGGKDSIIRALETQSHFSIFNKSYLYWIDAQGIYSPLDELAMKTRVRKKIFGIEAWVESIECLIVAKLSIYYSEQSLKDVISIFRVSRELINMKTLYDLARRFGVLNRLKKLLQKYS